MHYAKRCRLAVKRTKNHQDQESDRSPQSWQADNPYTPLTHSLKLELHRRWVARLKMLAQICIYKHENKRQREWIGERLDTKCSE